MVSGISKIQGEPYKYTDPAKISATRGGDTLYQVKHADPAYLAKIVQTERKVKITEIKPKEIEDLAKEIDNFKFVELNIEAIRRSQYAERLNQKAVKKISDQLYELIIKYSHLGDVAKVKRLQELESIFKKKVIKWLGQDNYFKDTRKLSGETPAVQRATALEFHKIEDYLGVVQSAYFLEFEKKEWLMKARDVLFNNFETQGYDKYEMLDYNNLNIMSYSTWIMTELANDTKNAFAASKLLDQATKLYQNILAPGQKPYVYEITINGVTKKVVLAQSDSKGRGYDIRSKLYDTKIKEQATGEIDEPRVRRFQHIKIHAEMGLAGSYLVYQRFAEARQMLAKVNSEGYLADLRDNNDEFRKNLLFTSSNILMGEAGQYLEDGFDTFDNDKFGMALNKVNEAITNFNGLNKKGLSIYDVKKVEARLYLMKAQTLKARGFKEDMAAAREILNKDIFKPEKNYARYFPEEISLNLAEIDYNDNAINNILQYKKNGALIPKGNLAKFPGDLEYYSVLKEDEKACRGIFGHKTQRGLIEKRYRAYWLDVQARLTIAKRNDDPEAIRAVLGEIESFINSRTKKFSYNGETYSLLDVVKITDEEIKIILGEDINKAQQIFIADRYNPGYLTFARNSLQKIKALPIPEYRKELLISRLRQSKKMDELFLPEMQLSLAEGYNALEDVPAANKWLKEIKVKERRGKSDKIVLRANLAYADIEKLKDNDVAAYKYLNVAYKEVKEISPHLNQRDRENFNYLVRLSAADISNMRGEYEAAIKNCDDLVRELNQAQDIRHNLRRELVLANAKKNLGHLNYNQALIGFLKAGNDAKLDLKNIEQKPDDPNNLLGNDRLLTALEKKRMAQELRVNLAEYYIALGDEEGEYYGKKLPSHEIAKLYLYADKKNKTLIYNKDPLRNNTRAKMAEMSIWNYEGDLDKVIGRINGEFLGLFRSGLRSDLLRTYKDKKAIQCYYLLAGAYLRSEDVPEVRQNLATAGRLLQQIVDAKVSKAFNLKEEFLNLENEYVWLTGNARGMLTLDNKYKLQIEHFFKENPTNPSAQRRLRNIKRLQAKNINRQIELALRREDFNQVEQLSKKFTALNLTGQDKKSGAIIFEHRLKMADKHKMLGNFEYALKDLEAAKALLPSIEREYEARKVYLKIWHLAMASFYTAKRDWKNAGQSMANIHAEALFEYPDTTRWLARKSNKFKVDTKNGLVDEEFYCKARLANYENLLTQGKYKRLGKDLMVEIAFVEKQIAANSGNIITAALENYLRELHLLRWKFLTEVNGDEMLANSDYAKVYSYAHRANSRPIKDFVAKVADAFYDTRRLVNERYRVKTYLENQYAKAMIFYQFKQGDPFMYQSLPRILPYQQVRTTAVVRILGQDYEKWPSLFKENPAKNRKLSFRTDQDIELIIYQAKKAKKITVDQEKKLLELAKTAALFDFDLGEQDWDKRYAQLNAFKQEQFARGGFYKDLTINKKQAMLDGFVDLAMLNQVSFSLARQALEALYLDKPSRDGADPYLQAVNKFKTRFDQRSYSTVKERGYAYYKLAKMAIDDKRFVKGATSNDVAEYVARLVYERQRNVPENKNPELSLSQIKDLLSNIHKVKYCDESTYLMMKLLYNSRNQLRKTPVKGQGGFTWDEAVKWDKLKKRIAELEHRMEP